jgi:hypothetical protein
MPAESSVIRPVGATPSQLKRLAGTTPATVSAQLFKLRTDILALAQSVPAICTLGGGPCGNYIKGNSNVPIDSGVEFGYLDQSNRMEVDITAQ